LTNNIATNVNSMYYTIQEVAEVINCSTNYVRNLIAQRKSNGFPVSILKSANGVRNIYRINKRRLEAWLNKDNTTEEQE